MEYKLKTFNIKVSNNSNIDTQLSLGKWKEWDKESM
jgi:hypothetical protein